MENRKMKRTFTKEDEEATREAKALSWMSKNIKTKVPKIKSKIFGVKGSQFWRV